MRGKQGWEENSNKSVLGADWDYITGPPLTPNTHTGTHPNILYLITIESRSLVIFVLSVLIAVRDDDRDITPPFVLRDQNTQISTFPLDTKIVGINSDHLTQQYGFTG